MLKGVEFYIFVWILAAASITAFRHLTGKEKLTLAKVIFWSALYAVIALVIVVGIVILF